MATDKLRPARLNGVVVSLHAVVPDLVQSVEFALVVDQPIGEGMRRGIEIAVRLDEPGFGDDLSTAILHGEVYPTTRKSRAVQGT